MAELNISQANPYWCGEHWIVYLRPPGSDHDTGMFSLYNTRYSEAGEGIVAFIRVLEPVKFEAICTNNRKQADWVNERMIRGQSQYFDMPLPTLDASLARRGETLAQPSWTVEADGHRVAAQWNITEPPSIAHGRWPGEPAQHGFSVLFFTDDATITIDDQPVAGRAYMRDTWQPTLKADKSSCVFAIAETFTPWQGA